MVALIGGSSRTVKGASTFARSHGFSAFFVGATMSSVGYMIAVPVAVALLFHRDEVMGRWGGVACLALYVPALFLG